MSILSIFILSGCQEPEDTNYDNFISQDTIISSIEETNPRSNNSYPIFKGNIQSTAAESNMNISIYNNNNSSLLYVIRGVISDHNTWYANSSKLEDGEYYAEVVITNKSNTSILNKFQGNVFEIDTQINYSVNENTNRTNNNIYTFSGTMDPDVKNISLEITNPDQDLIIINAILNKEDNTWTASTEILLDGVYTVKSTALDDLNNAKEIILEDFEIDTNSLFTLDTIVSTTGELSTDGLSTIDITGTLSSDISNISLNIFDKNKNIVYEENNVSLNIEEGTWGDLNITLPDNKIVEDYYTANITGVDNLGNTKNIESNTFIINAVPDITVNDINDYSATTTPNFSGAIDNDFIEIKVEIENGDKNYGLSLYGNIHYPYWDSLTTEVLPDDYYIAKITGTTIDGNEYTVYEKYGFTVNTKKLIYSYCKDGEIGTLNDEGYLIVDETMLRDIINETSDLNVSVEEICTTRVENMKDLFKDKVDFNGDISHWDTTNVTDMSGMFQNAKNFNSPINNFVTTNVTTMANMFDGAESFDQVIMFETENVLDMSYMFRNSKAFNQLLEFDTTNVKTLNNMFEGADSYQQDITFNLISATDLSYMFSNNLIFDNDLYFTTSITEIDDKGTEDTSDDVTTVKTALENISNMFFNTKLFNKPLSFDTSTVTNMSGMFNTAIRFNSLIDFNTSSVTDMSNMFYSARDFNQTISDFNTSEVIDMSYMFEYATNFDQNITNWDTSNVENMSNMFYYASSFDQNITNWDTSNVENMDEMFANSLLFDQNLTSWCTESVLTEPLDIDVNAVSWEDDFKPSNWGVSCP